MTYEQMLIDLDEIPMFGKAAGLPNLSSYLAYLNHPEENFRVIHVAGTNGKGSVCAYLESIFRTAGYTTGLFISPHLIRINERIRINFKECSDDEMAAAWQKVKELIENREKLGLQMLTYFEILFLIAMVIFGERKPDICIVETGLGGRLDATVLTNPVLSVITSISLDHTAILGEIIEEIAFEKAGILKKSVPAVVLRKDETAWRVIQKRAQTVGAPLFDVSPNDLMLIDKNKNSIDFSIKSRYYNCDSLRISSIAAYQMENAALAALAATLVEDRLTKEQIAYGIQEMFWEGRMEEISPGLYVDGAHNPGAVELIGKTIQEDSGKWNLLFAVCQDKDYHAMITTLTSFPWNKIYVTHFEGSRAATVQEIYDAMQESASCEVAYFADAKDAMEKISYSADQPLLCLGSLYFVGEIKKFLQ